MLSGPRSSSTLVTYGPYRCCLAVLGLSVVGVRRLESTRRKKLGGYCIHPASCAYTLSSGTTCPVRGIKRLCLICRYTDYIQFNGISNVMSHYCDIQLKLMTTFYITILKWDVDTRYLCKWKTNFGLQNGSSEVNSMIFLSMLIRRTY